jgi:acyl dehydratase
VSAPAAPSPAPRLAPGLVGTGVGPLAAAVDARWLMAYAAAVGEASPCAYDTRVPAGPLAHPLFPVCYEWPAALALRAATVDPTVAPLGVHAVHHLVLHRLPRAGDRLLTTARVASVRRRRAGTLVIVRFETVDGGGRPVSTTHHGTLYRGVDGEDEGAAPAAAPLPTGAEPAVWAAPLEVGPGSAHVYTECARIWNPIHTDLAAARAAGLPGPILHGTATLALAVSRVVDQELGGDPARVREVHARFTDMVPIPSTLIVHGLGRRDDVRGFAVIGGAGQAVVVTGALRG